MATNSQHEKLSIETKEVRLLRLDADNPRLAHLPIGRTQEDLVRAMWREMAVDELCQSIAENGFFPEEPLLAIPDPDSPKHEQRFIVVEGNRRLTAVMLLLDADLRKSIRATDIPTISEEQIEQLRSVPVAIYPNKEALWEYFGFRHVNGPKEWDALSKATYVAKIHRQGHSLEEIARKIGDKNQTVKRFYRGYVLLEQAERSAGFDRANVDQKRFHFSHLYTAAAYPQIQKFLGISDDGSLAENPVSPESLPDLKELMTWLFGDRELGKPAEVRKQNPDLGRLRDVIDNRQALSAIRSGISLERAYAISRGDTRRFEEALINAKDALQEARGTVTTGYAGDPSLLREMEGVLKIGNAVLKEMRDVADSTQSN
jgi:hypothetical protein